MAILVTGGAGYIGSHTCVELVNAGYDIVILDTLSGKNQRVIDAVSQTVGKELKFYPIDLWNQEDIESVFLENHVEAVMHFPERKPAGEYASIPCDSYIKHVTGTIILSETMKKFQVKKIVFSSSATVYGNPGTVPIAENSILNPIHSYGQNMLMMEEILRDLYREDQKWSITILRYHNPTGAHETGCIGGEPGETLAHLLAYLSQFAMGKSEYLPTYKDGYVTIDGSMVHDYIHVVDLARGHIKALERTLKNSDIEAYNLGKGEGYSAMQLVAAFEAATGMKIPYVIANPKEGEDSINYVDPTKAGRELEWKAEKDLKDMCKDTWRWRSNQQNRQHNGEKKLFF